MHQKSMVGNAPLGKRLLWLANHTTLVQLPGVVYAILHICKSIVPCDLSGYNCGLVYHVSVNEWLNQIIRQRKHENAPVSKVKFKKRNFSKVGF
jgi:hypothetical protein